MPRKNLLSLHEAIVVALINEKGRMAAYEKLTAAIIERGLYISEDNYEGLLQKVKDISSSEEEPFVSLFEIPHPDFVRMKDDFGMFPIIMSDALDNILNAHSYFYNPFTPKLRVFDEASEFPVEKAINPAKTICIATKKLPGLKKPRKSGRKKFIYYLDTDLRGNEVVNIYHINESMDNLKMEIDKLNSYLAIISDNILVNVGYYTLSNSKELSCILDFDELKDVKTVWFSESKKAKDNFERFQTVQKFYEMRIWLQKAVLNYKNENQFPLTGKFGA